MRRLNRSPSPTPSRRDADARLQSARCSTPSSPPGPGWRASSARPTSSTTASTSTAQFDGAGDEIAGSKRSSSRVATWSSPARRRCRVEVQLNSNWCWCATASSSALRAGRSTRESNIPADVATLPQPVFGFYGLVAEWVDLEAMRWSPRPTRRDRWCIVGEHNNANAAAWSACARCPTSTSSAASRTRSCPATARRSTSRCCRSSRTS